MHYSKFIEMNIHIISTYTTMFAMFQDGDGSNEDDGSTCGSIELYRYIIYYCGWNTLHLCLLVNFSIKTQVDIFTPYRRRKDARHS